jgi:hypothetical protein
MVLFNVTTVDLWVCNEITISKNNLKSPVNQDFFMRYGQP